MCFGVQGLKGISNSTLGSLETKERNRRLIPYMTYYLGQPQNSQYRQVMAVPQYIAVPQFRPVPQRYLQQPSPLTRMITQNYLALAKQIQGNPRLQQVRVNPNYSPDGKYYLAVPNQQTNVPQVAETPYDKPENNFQYVRPQAEEQYSKQQENDYEQPDEDLQPNLQVAKPPPDVLLQYTKPEVQQYVTKYDGHDLSYIKQDETEYQGNVQQRIPVQYPSQYAIKSSYPKNINLQQYYTRPQESSVSYSQKPQYQYAQKVVANLSPQPADIPAQKPQYQYTQKVVANLAPQPAEIPEYITTPIHKPRVQIRQKIKEPAVTITQSEEIDVDSLPTSPAPPKYHAKYVEKPQSYISYPIQPLNQKQTQELDPEVVDKNYNDILEGVSLSKTLPERITTGNLDYSIKTLSKILRILQRAQNLPQSAKTLIQGFPKPTETLGKTPRLKIKPHQQYTDGSTPGRPNIDYPAYDEIPQTSFNCKDQRYKGFFGDPETGCQVWHYCDLNGGQASFLCPNGTIFSQVALTCDWWFNVKCASTAQLYVLNERLYKYILPQKPSFPEDYSGPLVDHYLSLKFKEIEEKNKNKTEEAKNEKEEEEEEQPFSIDPVTQNKVRSVG